MPARKGKRFQNRLTTLVWAPSAVGTLHTDGQVCLVGSVYFLFTLIGSGSMGWRHETARVLAVRVGPC